MDRFALTRLRVGFVVFGALLLLPLYGVLQEMDARLEDQRRLRHQIVAERIFDEMERELTTLLEVERSRPSAAYDATQTRVSSWSPFVVGYFTRDSQGLRMPARGQLSATRSMRVEQAVAQVWAPSLSPAPAPAPLPLTESQEAEDQREEAEPVKALGRVGGGERQLRPARRRLPSAASRSRSGAGTGAGKAGLQTDGAAVQALAEAQSMDDGEPAEAVGVAKDLESEALDVDEEPTPATTKRPLPKQESVLRQLNRGAAERQQEKKKARSRAAEPDPLQGF